MSRLARAVLLGGLALVMSACNEAQPVAMSEAPGTTHWQGVLESAELGGALEPQLAAIRDAAETGSMPLQTLNQLVDETFACFVDAGIPHELSAPEVVATGIELRRYTFSGVPGLSEDQSLALADKCIDGYSFFAETGFRAQPTTQQLIDAVLEEEIPIAIACLRDHNVDIRDDATIDEVRIASREFITQSIRDGAELVICWPEHEPE